jgi:hypothetical protein
MAAARVVCLEIDEATQRRKVIEGKAQCLPTAVRCKPRWSDALRRAITQSGPMAARRRAAGGRDRLVARLGQRSWRSASAVSMPRSRRSLAVAPSHSEICSRDSPPEQGRTRRTRGAASAAGRGRHRGPRRCARVAGSGPLGAVVDAPSALAIQRAPIRPWRSAVPLPPEGMAHPGEDR